MYALIFLMSTASFRDCRCKTSMHDMQSLYRRPLRRVFTHVVAREYTKIARDWIET